MKKLSVLFILPLLLLLFSGCQTADQDAALDAPTNPPPEGCVWVYCLTSRSSANGYSLTMVYDESGNLLEFAKNMDKGSVYKKVYDAQGNLLRDDTLDGTVIYTYNENGDVLTVKSSYNDVRYTYDEEGKCISWCFLNSDGTPRETYQNTYDEKGNRISVRIYNGDKTAPDSGTDWVYDDQGNLLEERRYLDGEVYIAFKYTYDEAGRLLTEDQENRGQPFTGSTYTYNAAGNEILRTSYLHENGQRYNSSITWTYDENENLLERKDIGWQGDVNLLVATYDYNGNKLTETYTNTYGTIENRRYTEWTYDHDGSMLSEYFDWSGFTSYTLFTYDRAGRITKKHSTSGSENNQQQFLYEWDYDSEGNLLSYSYPASETSRTTISYTYTVIAVPIEMVEKVQAQQAEIWKSMDEYQENINLH
ncbi:MAG: hypothetical protein E7439_02835 [Ruminococcaceae bacterium]|nr:hypothetical protein [Oscillospiraceae bacterium]